MDSTINIAVSSRAIFNLEDEHSIFEEEGLEAYLKVHAEREGKDVALEPGTAYVLVKAIRKLNEKIRNIKPDIQRDIVNVILMSHNPGDVGIRLIKAIDKNDLKIRQMCLTDGTNPVKYLRPYDVDLFLTLYREEQKQAIEQGIGAGTLYEQNVSPSIDDGEDLRIAFDCDCVLFSEESEKVYKAEGLDGWIRHENTHKDTPIEEGPLKKFAEKIGQLQKLFRDEGIDGKSCPIRTYIVTARQACDGPGQRALKTLQSWGLRIHESHFLSGMNKDSVLSEIRPHIFFDDGEGHIKRGREAGIPSARV